MLRPSARNGAPVSEEEEAGLEALLAQLRAERRAAEPAASEFGERLKEALVAAVEHLRAKELVEVSDEQAPALIEEVTGAGLDARSPKQLMKSVVRTLIRSELVEEVYGTDEMLFDELRQFLDS